MRRGGALAPLLIGLVVGMLLGWSYGRVFHVMRIQETDLPCPVIPPPRGFTWVHVLTTGYCPCPICCGPFANGHTAINRDVMFFPFGIAAAPGQIPYLTTLEIPGYGTAQVDDTGGAMRQDAQRGQVHLDLRFKVHAQAMAWGRRRMWIALPANLAARLLPAQSGSPEAVRSAAP